MYIYVYAENQDILQSLSHENTSVARPFTALKPLQLPNIKLLLKYMKIMCITEKVNFVLYHYNVYYINYNSVVTFSLMQLIYM